MVGLPCSGKTTLAQKLEREQSALRLTTDEWHVRLFGQDAEEPEHDARHGLIEAMLWNIASRAGKPVKAFPRPTDSGTLEAGAIRPLAVSGLLQWRA